MKIVQLVNSDSENVRKWIELRPVKDISDHKPVSAILIVP